MMNLEQKRAGVVVEAVLAAATFMDFTSNLCSSHIFTREGSTNNKKANISRVETYPNL